MQMARLGAADRIGLPAVCRVLLRRLAHLDRVLRSKWRAAAADHRRGVLPGRDRARCRCLVRRLVISAKRGPPSLAARFRGPIERCDKSRLPISFD
jgi:hypothetical protein